MNLFTSQQAPAILALFVAVVGFYISTVIAEIRAQATITYRFETADDGSATLRLENVSLTQIVQSARFEIACTDGRAECLAPDANGDFASLRREPPVSPSNTQVEAAAEQAQLSATLVPGAAITLAVQKADSAGGTPLEFYYTASRTAPEAILLLDADSLTARFVDSYFDLMLVGFLAAAAGLAVLILVPPLRLVLAKQTPPPPDS